jgi:hypothetical protein
VPAPHCPIVETARDFAAGIATAWTVAVKSTRVFKRLSCMIAYCMILKEIKKENVCPNVVLKDRVDSRVPSFGKECNSAEADSE